METRFQRFSEYQKALILWLRGGKKGTQPRKVRANSRREKTHEPKAQSQKRSNEKAFTQSDTKSEDCKGSKRENRQEVKRRGIVR
jgi:hypothetical protein